MITEQSDSRCEKWISFVLCGAFLAMAVLPYVSLDAEAGTPSANYTLTASSAGALAITPENNWVNDPINVAGAVTITGVDISLGITHASPADLSVWIANPAGAWVNIPWAPWGGARQTFSLNNFNGLSSAGNWRLWMVDGVVNGVTGKEDLCTLTISYSLGSNMVVPAVGATVSGSFIVSVSATSAASCRLFVDDQWVSDLTYNNGIGRWEYNLDTRAFPDGAHTLVAVARDVQGNEVADGHAVAFDNWNIYCGFNSPAWGATISGWTSITALVPDYSTRGELYVDNDLVGVDTTVSGGQYGIWLYTNNYPDGNYNLRWIAYDPDGKAAAATEPVSVDNYAMTCTVSSPASGSTVVGSITVAATVPAYAARGDLYLDGVFTGQDTTLSGGQFTYTLDTRGYPDGIHVITVQAFDPDGNSGVGASSVTFNNYNIVPTITQPGTGLPISGSPTFRVETQSYAVRGELYVDGSLYAVRTTLLNSGAIYYYQFTLPMRARHRLRPCSQWQG